MKLTEDEEKVLKVIDGNNWPLILIERETGLSKQRAFSALQKLEIREMVVKVIRGVYKRKEGGSKNG